jgi:hypothetical protein
MNAASRFYIGKVILPATSGCLSEFTIAADGDGRDDAEQQ